MGGAVGRKSKLPEKPQSSWVEKEQEAATPTAYSVSVRV